MRISTASLFNTSTQQLQARQNSAAESQAKLGSGKQLLNPSDDTDKANLIASLNSAKARYQVYGRNLDQVQTRLSAEESVLTSMNQIIQRVEELTIQAGNDSLAASDRDVIGKEVKALRDELFKLVNTTDIAGNYIFSGNKFDQPAFVEDASGNVAYNGDFGRLDVNVSDVRQIRVNTLGPELFSTEDFAALDDLVDQLSSDDGDGIRAGLTAIAGIGEKLTVSYGAMAGRASAIDSHRELMEESEVRLDQLLMRENDLDYAEAITDLNREMLALQALQASFAKITQLSLFDYVR